MLNELLGSIRELLEHGSINEAKAAIKDTINLDNDVVLPFLYNIFSDKPYVLCHTAMEVLINKGEPAFKYICNLYNASNNNQKYWIIRTLINGRKEEYRFLSNIIDKEDQEICAFLATQLSHSFNKDLAIPLLIKLLKKPGWLVKKNASETLIDFGRVCIPYIKDLFKLKDRNLKYWVVKILATLLKDEMLPFFEKMLNESPERMGYYALIGFDTIDNEKAYKMLIGVLEHPYWMLQVESAEILKRKGEKVIPFLKNAYKKSSVRQKYWLLRLIAEILQERAIDFLQRIILKGNIEIRYYAVIALGLIKSGKVVNILIDCLADRAWIIRKQSAKILTRMGDISLPAIQLGVSDLREDVAFWCIKILSDLANWDINLYLDLFKHPDKKRRIFAIQQSVNIRNKNDKIISELVKRLDDSHWIVRKEAADAIIKIGEKALEELFLYLSQNHDSKHANYWGGYIFKNIKDDIARKFIVNKINVSESNDSLRIAIRLICSVPKINVLLELVNIFLRSDKLFRNRLKELIISEGSSVLIKPFLKSLKNIKRDVAMEIVEILASFSDIDKFKFIKDELLKSSEDQAYWLYKILLDSNHPAKYQYFIDCLSRELRDRVKIEVFKMLSNYKEIGLSKAIMEYYLSVSEEDKKLFLKWYKGIPPEGIIDNWIIKFAELSKKQSFWLAKFLQKYLIQYSDIYQRFVRHSNKKVREWCIFILE